PVPAPPVTVRLVPETMEMLPTEVFPLGRVGLGLAVLKQALPPAPGTPALQFAAVLHEPPGGPIHWVDPPGQVTCATAGAPTSRKARTVRRMAGGVIRRSRGSRYRVRCSTGGSASTPVRRRRARGCSSTPPLPRAGR